MPLLIVVLALPRYNASIALNSVNMCLYKTSCPLYRYFELCVGVGDLVERLTLTHESRATVLNYECGMAGVPRFDSGVLQGAFTNAFGPRGHI